VKNRMVAMAALSALAALSACKRNDAKDTGGAKLNEATPLAAPGPDSPAGDTSADDPKTGLNTQRPDSAEDLKPKPP
jgi:hypothetical protein